MPGAKKQIPAPIDRPLSKAYLREFSGWSTAFPPGLSDPSSLRIMENVMVNRDGSVRIRPGLRYLSYGTAPVGGAAGIGIDKNCVGSHEPFFLNDGTKAYLFAVREADNTVGFRVLVGNVVKLLTAAGVDFSVPQGVGVLAFTAATTYVKYLQIDNKIFALSNAGETMRLFNVGASKSARKLNSIDRPDFTLADKLTVVHPDAGWVTGSTPVSQRTNLIPTPSFESSVANWGTGAYAALSRSSAAGAQVGTYAARIESMPQRTNHCFQPLHDVASTGQTGWGAGSNTSSVVVNGSALRANTALVADGTCYVNGSWASVIPGKTYKVAVDITEGSDGYVYFGCVFRWLDASGNQIGGDVAPIDGNSVFGFPSRAIRGGSSGVTAPAGAAYVALFFKVIRQNNTAAMYWGFKNVNVYEVGESDAMFSGASGANYFWTGAVNASASVYHPPVDVYAYSAQMPVAAALNYVASIYAKAGSTVRSVKAQIAWYNASGTWLQTDDGAAANDSAGAWTRYSKSMAPPATATKGILQVTVSALPRNEYHYLDAAMFEQAAAIGAYFDGDTVDTSTIKYDWTGTPYSSSSTESVYAAGTTIPPAETPTANTLVSNAAASNIYNFAYFYTVYNEVGESAASQVTVIRTQRRWTGWKWEAANASGEPNGTIVSDPNLAADQLVAYMPSAVYDAVKAQGAVGWSLYMLTWSDQDSVPVEGVLLGTKPITTGGTHGIEGWQRNTPQLSATGFSGQVPTASNRYNYSSPSSAAQGLVASDRLILVDDPVAPAVIRWSSNQQGEYTNFTAAKGGGYKTLTSGNLYIPASVKLWQNPQSVDTLTILCQGVDGQNTGYYMAPATVSSQSEQTNIMGFEETTATPGTTSPYGCEVLNNALYHPLDESLVKSTAANYNINHKSQTDQIYDRWSQLANKQRIISSQLDNRLYFIVHNPDGEPLQSGCMGNEIWVFDTAATTGNWSRWLIQANSLRKIEYAGKIYMSVVRPDGIYYLDPFYDRDDVVDPADLSVDTAFIAWQLETNTQGANRAHDAWAHLQQLSVALGNFQGSMEYGLRSRNIHGKDILLTKLVRDLDAPSTDGLPWDIADNLRVAQDLMEWYFFARSVVDEDDVVQWSAGQVNLVQYRYTPVTVNVGYENGSVETFEYSRASLNWADRTTDNGVPQPVTDIRRP